MSQLVDEGGDDILTCTADEDAVHLPYNLRSNNAPQRPQPRATNALFGNGAPNVPLLATAAATHEEAVQRLYEVENKIRAQPNYQEHRQDGYMPGKDFFSKDWVDIETARIRALREHPKFEFIERVAGFANKKVESLFDFQAFDQNAKRKLQTEATFAKVRDEALRELAGAQTVVERAQKAEEETVTSMGEVRAAHANLQAIENAYAENVQPVLNALDADNAVRQTSSLRQWFTFNARCKYPAEGADSRNWADDVLKYFETIAERDAFIEVRENNAVPINKIKEHQPRLMRLSAIMAFLPFLASVRDNLTYVVRRVHAANLFHKDSVYAAQPQKFEEDTLRLVDLLAEETPANYQDYTQTHVTWQRTSMQVYKHLVCMHERFYPPLPVPTADGNDGAPAAVAADANTCAPRPVLVEPTLIQPAGAPEQERAFTVRGGNRTRRADVLRAVPKELRDRVPAKIDAPSDYQLFLLEMFTPLFRYGLSTLLFDVAKLRAFLCERDTRLLKSLVCAHEDSASATKKSSAFLLVEPSRTLDQTLVRVDYFFGGVKYERAFLISVSPEGDVDRVRNFFNRVVALYNKALQNVLQDDQVQGAEDVHSAASTRPKSDTDFINSLNTEAVGCAASSLGQHANFRRRAAVEIAGALELFRSYVRQLRSLRTSIEALRRAFGGTVEQGIIDMLEEHALDSMMLDAEEAALMSSGNTADEAFVHAARHAMSLLLGDTVEFNFLRNVSSLWRRIDNILNDAQQLQAQRAQQLREAAQRVIDEVQRRAGRMGPPTPEDEQMESIVQRMKNLKILLAETYVPSAAWSMDPQNTGTVFVNAKYKSSAELAYECVQENVPNLAECTLEDLELSPITCVVFAQLVAHMMTRTEGENPSTLTLNRFLDDVLKSGRRIAIKMRKLPQVPNVGLGAKGRGGYGRVSGALPAEGDYYFGGNDELCTAYGGKAHGTRNHWVMQEARTFRRDYERKQEQAKAAAEARESREAAAAAAAGGGARRTGMHIPMPHPPPPKRARVDKSFFKANASASGTMNRFVNIF